MALANINFIVAFQLHEGLLGIGDGPHISIYAVSFLSGIH